MKSKSLLLLGTCLAVAITSCATKEHWQKKTNNPPRFADRVELLVYEQPKKPELPTIEIFDETRPIQKPHRKVALLTCEGAPREELVMTKALIYRARMLGADAVIILPPNAYQGTSGFYGVAGGGRNIFRAQAVIYE